MMQRLRLAVVLLCLYAAAHAGNAQGCSQCRDNISQSDPAMQRSYRVAIAILLAGALTVAGTGIVVVRRFGR